MIVFEAETAKKKRENTEMIELKCFFRARARGLLCSWNILKLHTIDKW